MPKERFFIEQPLEENATLSIQDDEFHHLVNVMRAKVKQQIEIVNGCGELGTGFVESIEKRKANLYIEKVIYQKPNHFKVILAQAIPRPNRLDYILEKATELGVTEIWLFPGYHSERKDLKENQIERMKTITIAAMKQCGRLHLPKIIFKPGLEKFSSTKLEYPAFFGDVESEALPFLDQWKKSEKEEGVIFFIGPETGFSDKEILILKEINAKGVKLGSHILRTDTAAIVALALINHQLLC